ncbi:MAG: hypothetical protein AAFR98_03760 [Pseudomonadota bacterium]
MTRTMIFAVAAIFGTAFLFSTMAQAAQPICGDRAKLIKVLAERYKETLRSAGTDGAANRVEVFANTKTGTWSLVVSKITGEACIIAAGSNFSEATAT